VASPEDFSSFYAGAFPRLVGQLLLVTGELHEAEDVVQEAFARASVRWARLRDYDVPEAWVRRVAMNLAADRLRRARRQLAALVRLGPASPVPPVQVEDLALLEALRALPMSQRQVIVLHHLLGMPVEEVAATLTIPTGTVKTRLARGRRALAARLGERAHQQEVRPDNA
jgi:RNA polymerase sigma-70 factor (ECF subfamily)